jgi:hypothetical protein
MYHSGGVFQRRTKGISKVWIEYEIRTSKKSVYLP